MKLEIIGRFFNITNCGQQICQIYQDKNQSAWQKIPRILARLLGLSADSLICLQPNQNDKVKILSLVVDRVLTPAVDIKTPRDLVYSAVSACMIANSTGILKISPGAAYLIDCLLNNKTQACENMLGYMKQNYKKAVTKKFVANPEITQFLQDLKKSDPHNHEKIIQEMINDYRKILEKNPSTEFSKIPHCFYDDEKFQKRICCISKQPIREVVVIKGFSGNLILYDFFNLLVWWHLMAGKENPPCWPKSIFFSRYLIKIDEVETSQITMDLQESLDKVDPNIMETQLRTMELFLQTA